MPETANYGFEYETPQSKPGITLTGDIDGSAPILAEQVDAVIAGIDSRLTGAEGSIATLEAGASHDTGWLALAVTPGTGFTLSTAVYRQWGPVVSIRIDCTRTGADIVANSQGNVVGDPLLCTIDNVDVRTSEQLVATINASVTSGSGIMATSGTISIADLNSNSVIATDNIVRVTSTYFATTFV
jgi:hypothetical protein